MTDFWINTVCFLLAFSGMEGVAWFTHKYVMHGMLWNLHQDHHTPSKDHVMEKNDLFFLIFSIPGIIGLVLGLWTNFGFLFWIGLGITIYGLAYFLVHDIFIHQRIKWFKRTNNRYFRAIRKAHKVHHKHRNKHNGECFGMLWVPLKYFKEASRTR